MKEYDVLGKPTDEFLAYMANATPDLSALCRDLIDKSVSDGISIVAVEHWLTSYLRFMMLSASSLARVDEEKERKLFEELKKKYDNKG